MPTKVEIWKKRRRLKSALLPIFLLLGSVLSVLGADPQDYAVEISVDVLAGPLALRLGWPSSDFARQYFVRRRTPGATVWGNPLATLPASATGYTDTAISDGVPYEYEVQMETAIPNGDSGWVYAYGYVTAGANVSIPELKGKVLLMVDSTVSGALSDDLLLFQADLVGAGWTVVRRDVNRTASPVEVRDQIKAEYTADPSNLRAAILIGHVPTPYSGNIAPDLHEAHRGAWPADSYYAELDGTWTDSSVNVTSFDSEDNDNRPGDGKFDQSDIPGAVELEVGRIDFWQLPGFNPRSEIDLLKNYLRKDHAFRHRAFTAARQGLIRDNFGDLDGDAPAVDAWRHYPQFFGPNKIRAVGPDTFFSTLSNESFLWAYGCGGGGYTKADGVGSTYDFAASDPKAVFLILHGSYFGDWNNSDNFLRAAIATPNYTLASIWSGLPHWFMHPMGLGQTVGFCTKLTQNNLSDYKSHQNFSPREVHIALMGDPTLEMFPVAPPSNLSGAPGTTVSLSWTASVDENLVGYQLYYSAAPSGPFQRITSSPVTTTSFSHNIGAGTYYYMVRAVKLERTGSGTFYNLSQGIVTSVTQGSAGSLPTISTATTDGEASEDGDRGEVKFVRSGSTESDITVDFLIGGTAENGVDYQLVPGSITIPAGKTEASVQIVPTSDTLREGDETITLQIRLSDTYTLGSPAVGFLQLHDVVINQPPTMTPILDQTVPSNGSVLVSFQVSDPESAPENLFARAVSLNPSVIAGTGLILEGGGADRTLRITPLAGAVGSAGITLLLSDGTIEISRTFTVTVTPPNYPPRANSQVVTTFRNSSMPITLTGSDPEGGPLSFVIKTLPAKGTLAGNPPNLIYQPNNEVIGPDSFTFAVTDGVLESTPATVGIQIVATNRPPVASSQQVIVAEDGFAAITLSGSDPDGNAIEFQIVTGPKHGALTGTGQNYTYRPATNYNGADDFTYRISDGKVFSNTGTVSISVNPVNDPPVAVSANVQATEDQPSLITLSASDLEGDLLSYTLLTLPTKGEITGTAPALVYTPRRNSVGTDILTFKVSDGSAESFVATVSIAIRAVNDSPTAFGQSISTPEDTAVAITLNGTDPDLDALSYRVVIAPQKGTLTGTGPNVLYTPNPDVSGADTFVFVVNDGTKESSPATVQIQVEPRNDAPTVSGIAPQAIHKNGVAGPVAFLVQDVDRPIGELAVVANSSDTNVVASENIQLTGEGTNRVLMINPTKGAVGSTLISVRVSDGQAEAESTFLLTITNTPPVALADSVSVYGPTVSIPAAQLTSNDLDADNDILRVVDLSASRLGARPQFVNGVIVYDGKIESEDSFEYTIEDSSGARATGIVTLILAEQPRVESIQKSGGNFILNVLGIPSSVFRVQSSIDATNWTASGEGRTDSTGRGVFTESGALEHHRFYRVEWP